MNPQNRTELEKLEKLESYLLQKIPDPSLRLLFTCVAELYRTRYELNCYHEGKIAAAKIDKGKGI